MVYYNKWEEKNVSIFNALLCEANVSIFASHSILAAVSIEAMKDASYNTAVKMK